MSSRPRLTLVAAVVAASSLLLGACGDDGQDAAPPEDGAVEPTTDTTADIDAPAPEPEPTTTEPDTDTEATPPAEDTGTVTVGDQTAELGPGDFLICETVNPAFDENVNVVVDLPFDSGELRVSGDLPDSVDAELGELFASVVVEGIDVARDGRTLSGSAVADGTQVEFSFTC